MEENLADVILVFGLIIVCWLTVVFIFTGIRSNGFKTSYIPWLVLGAIFIIASLMLVFMDICAVSGLPVIFRG